MQSTRLAAIMFTDIAGYSAMMEENEPRTIQVIERHNEIVFPIIAAAGGEVVDAIGDGLLVMFPSVTVAVQCGLEIHRAIDAYNTSTDAEKRFHLRIGVHQGEVWQNENRIFGNGVNIAARVQPFAKPGGMCLSEDAQRQVANKIEVQIRSIGIKALKNISRRIELFEVKTGREITGSTPQESGEFDEIKEKLIEERVRIAEKRADNIAKDANDLGTAIENRVFNFVEKAMDSAIGKWDQRPEEKKRSIESDFGKNIKFHIETDSSGHRHKAQKKKVAKKKKRSSIGGNLSAGLIFGGICAFGAFGHGVSWLLAPMILFGVIPFTRGMVQATKLLYQKKQERKQRPRELEQQILESASELGGRVTVVQIATRTGISLDEASMILDEMTKKGYLLQHILETGVIQYEFPALARPELDAEE